MIEEFGGRSNDGRTPLSGVRTKSLLQTGSLFLDL